MHEKTSEERCCRCGQVGAARVCAGCRAQESVARHIPSARRWFNWR
jgi:hypothetical protein